MTLSFPCAMPAKGCGQQTFEPDRADFLTRAGGGRLGSMSAGFPIWKASWTLGGSMGAADSDLWRAFVASLQGSSNLFYGKDVERPYPKAYPNGFAALGWSGDCSAWSQSVVAGVPVLAVTSHAGLIIGPGDYVGFRWTTGGLARQSLVRSLEAVTADGSGHASFAITPAVPALTPGTAVAYFANPTCLMRMDPRATQLSDMDRRRAIGGTIVAFQDLLP